MQPLVLPSTLGTAFGGSTSSCWEENGANGTARLPAPVETLFHLESMTGLVWEGTRVPPSQEQQPQVRCPLCWRSTVPLTPPGIPVAPSPRAFARTTGVVLPARCCRRRDTPAARRVPAAFIMALPYLSLRASQRDLGMRKALILPLARTNV